MKKNQAAKQLASAIYAIRLSAAAAKFGAASIGITTAIFIRSYKILIFLYLLIFIQVLLLVFQPNLKPSPPKISSEKKYRQKLGRELNLSSLQTYELKISANNAEDELARYERDLELVGGHRDILINLGMLNLALQNEESYQKYLNSARSIDPNWHGFTVDRSSGSKLQN